MIPRKLAPFVFALISSGIMSFLVSGVATARNMGFIDGFVGLWMSAWIPAWALACPTLFLIAPSVRAFVGRNTRRNETP